MIAVASRLLDEVRRREKAYRGDRPFPELGGKNVILTDGGLATGFTMIAAVRMARERGALSVNMAVQVSPDRTFARIEPLADPLPCLHVPDRYPFAVASSYDGFHDLSDGEVLRYLGESIPPRQ